MVKVPTLMGSLETTFLGLGVVLMVLKPIKVAPVTLGILLTPAEVKGAAPGNPGRGGKGRGWNLVVPWEP